MFTKPMPVLLLLPILALSLGAVACGGDESAGTTTNEGGQAESAVVSVELGEDGSRYFVKVDKPSVPAGSVTF